MVSVSNQEDAILSRLRGEGYKITPQRRAIVRAILSSDEYVTPELLLIKARQAFPSLGRVTVYRTLDVLSRLGLLCTLHPEGHHPGYTLGRLDHHHHVVCSGCGRVSDFSAHGLEELEKRLSRETGFKIEGHILEFLGLCPQCQETNNEK